MSFTLYIKEKDGKFFYSANKGLIDQKLPDNIKTRDDVMQYFKSSGTPIEFLGITNQPIRQYKVYISDKLAMYTNLDNKDRRAIHLSDDLLKNEDEVRRYIAETEALRGFEADVIFSNPK